MGSIGKTNLIHDQSGSQVQHLACQGRPSLALCHRTLDVQGIKEKAGGNE